MKRIYLGLLLLSAVGIFACNPQTTENTPAPNANAAASPGASTTLVKPGPNVGDLTAFGEVLVTITISDDADKKPYISKVDPESADLSGGMRVQWLVQNQSTQPAGENATVDIGPFTGKGSPNNKQPFGVDPCANSFKLNFLKEGKDSREISEQANFQTGETAYEYDVVLKAEDGSELYRVPRRPEIIISGMVLKPEASPKPTPKPPSPPKPRT